MFQAREAISKGGDIRVIAIAFFLGTFMSVSAMSSLGLHLPLIPDHTSRDESLILSLVASLCLASAVAPLARGIRGSRMVRFATMAAFTYVSFAVINQMEAAVYSTLSGAPTILVVFAPPCILAAAAAVWLVPSTDESIERATGFRTPPIPVPWWRLFLAFLALPTIEFVTGIFVQPLLAQATHEEVLGLVTPSGMVVMCALLLKSVLLLAVVTPITLRWTGSRRFLTLALGFALFVLTGLFGLLQATWWPMTMRITLSLQILITSMAYAATVVALLVPRPKIDRTESSPLSVKA